MQRRRMAACFAAAMTVGGQFVFADTRDGWSQQWQDTFSGTSIDTSRWEVLTRQDSFNNEKQYYTPNAVTVSGGYLNITASNSPLGNKAYQSGLVRTWNEDTYGRWEVRASLPSTQGMWPAIWLLPRYVDWPSGGEIDIMENRGSAPTVVGSAYHYGTTVDNHQYVAQDFTYTSAGAAVSFQNSFHDYAVEWDPHRIRYMIDNVPAYTIYSGSVPVSASPMSMILNVAVGGDYGGDPNASTQFPQKMQVDSVTQYKRNAATANVINRSFEATSGDMLQEWNEYSNGANVSAETGNAHTGSKSLKLYGRYNNAANTSGVYQEIPTTPGAIVQFDEWAKNRPGDLLAGADEGRIKVEFIDANGDVINTGQLTTTNASSSTVYKQYAMRRVAPAGAVFARAVIEIYQINNAAGAFNVDDVNLHSLSSVLAGDIDLDGAKTTSDLDVLLHSLTADNTLFDFDANGSVNRADVTKILLTSFGTKDGDTNLDAKVDYADLVKYVANSNEQTLGTWSIADFTGDGKVNASDLAYIQANYGYGVTDGSRLNTDFPYAYALATGTPEPASLACIALAAMGLKRRRRERLL